MKKILNKLLLIKVNSVFMIIYVFRIFIVIEDGFLFGVYINFCWDDDKEVLVIVRFFLI